MQTPKFKVTKTLIIQTKKSPAKIREYKARLRVLAKEVDHLTYLLDKIQEINEIFAGVPLGIYYCRDQSEILIQNVQLPDNKPKNNRRAYCFRYKTVTVIKLQSSTENIQIERAKIRRSEALHICKEWAARGKLPMKDTSFVNPQ